MEYSATFAQDDNLSKAFLNASVVLFFFLESMRNLSEKYATFKILNYLSIPIEKTMPLPAVLKTG